MAEQWYVHHHSCSTPGLDSHTWPQQRTNAVHPGLESYMTPTKDRPVSDSWQAVLSKPPLDGVSLQLTISHNLHTINSTLVYLWIPNLESLGYGMILKSCYNSHWNYEISYRSDAPMRCAIESEANEAKTIEFITRESTDSEAIYSHNDWTQFIQRNNGIRPNEASQ